jgi:aspartyl-tRNA(Asn)/glutamyl-tRNA(Gln) amidotransferase subunit A
VALPPADPYKGLAGLFIGCESAGNFSELLTSGRVRELAQQGPDSWPNAFRIGATIPAADYLRAMQVRTQLQHAMREAMKDVDAYVTMPFAGPTMAFTNLTGHPSLVTRCGIANDLPASIEFIGQLYREDLLLRVGVAFEAATGANDVWPDTTRIPPLPPH